MKNSVKKLREKNPNVGIFISVGGATYPFPEKMTKETILDIIKYCDEFDLDGIDIDLENEAVCTGAGDSLKCRSDAMITGVLNDFGAAIKSYN